MIKFICDIDYASSQTGNTVRLHGDNVIVDSIRLLLRHINHRMEMALNCLKPILVILIIYDIFM